MVDNIDKRSMEVSSMLNYKIEGIKTSIRDELKIKLS